MTHSSKPPLKPPLSFELGASRLHGVLRAVAIRTDTLTQLVQHWADDDDRDAIIAALDELAAVVTGVAREGELDAAIEQVEDVAGMDTAHIEVPIPDGRRLYEELEAVMRCLSRFRHPAYAPTRAHMQASPFPAQRREGGAAA